MHYTLIVVDRDHIGVDELMEPFWQELEVEEYCGDDVSESDKQYMLDYYNERLAENSQEPYRTFEECYGDNGEDWNFNRWRKDLDGVWREYSTSNPNMEWDWYQVGGRWPGRLQLKEGVENVCGVSFSWGWPEEKMKQFLEENPNATDVALKKDISNLDEVTSFAVLKDDEWIILNGEKVLPYLEDVDDDAMLYSVDYHF